MAAEKMTKKIYFEVLKALVLGEDAPVEYESEDVIDFLNKEIDALDKKAAKAREKAAEKKAANDELGELVASVLTDELVTIESITVKVNDALAANGEEPVTRQKVTNRLSKLCDNGVASKEDVTYEAEDGKMKKCKAYCLFNEDIG